jgi:hypothetical protein
VLVEDVALVSWQPCFNLRSASVNHRNVDRYGLNPITDFKPGVRKLRTVLLWHREPNSVIVQTLIRSQEDGILVQNGSNWVCNKIQLFCKFWEDYVREHERGGGGKGLRKWSVTKDYTKATEWSPIESGDDSTRGFPLSAYCCTPLQPGVTYANQSEAFAASEKLSLPEFLLTEWRGDQMEGNIGRYVVV